MLDGRQTWKFDDNGTPQATVDKYWIGTLTVCIYTIQLMYQDTSNWDTPKTPMQAAENAAQFYTSLQTDDGHWAGEYGTLN